MSQDELDKGWTIETYVMHNEAMRISDRDHNEEMRRSNADHNEAMRAADDRRYAEVNVEKEKALLIKTTADDEAMRLARESQVYKDQQTDVMREKNLAASGVYATNTDLTTAVNKIEKALKPVFEFISSQQGINKGSTTTKGELYALIAAGTAIVGVIYLIASRL